MQNVTITGNLGQDAKPYDNSTAISVGVKQWNGKEKKEETVWWRVAFFGKDAERAAKLTKGTKITVQGKAFLKVYEGKVTPEVSYVHDWDAKVEKTGEEEW